MKKLEKLVLVDGNALVHRAYHALPPMSQKGEPTNAVYGFTSIFIKMIRELDPQYIVATFDLAGPTFRHEEFAKYKAHRPKTPEDLISQFAKVKEIVKAFGIPIYEKAGFEADDVIGTIAQKVNSNKKNIRVMIVTGDLDTLQLVNENTHVYTLRKGMSDTVVYDIDAVRDRFHLEPSQMNDFKGLKGDPSDNIPGVPGIGEKTATTLLTAHKSLEDIYKHIDDVPEKIRKKLIEYKEQALFSKYLSVIKRDVPIAFSLKKSIFHKDDIKKVIPLLKEFEFMSLVRRVEGQKSIIKKTDIKQSKEQDNKVISQQTSFKKVSRADIALIQKAPLVALHVLSQNDMSQDMITIAIDGKNIYTISWKDVKKILEDKNIKKIGYNLKQCIKEASARDIAILGITFDIQIAAYLLAPGKKEYTFLDIINKALKKDFSEEEILKQAAVYIYATAKKLEDSLRKEGLIKLFREIEIPLIAVLADMEMCGIGINRERLAKLAAVLKKKKKEKENKIYKLAGEEFNIDSPMQLSKILFEKLAIVKKDGKKLKKTKSGIVSTKAEELETLREDYPIISLVLIYRELAKLKSTYVDAFLTLTEKQEKIHTSYNQVGTATGRLASSEPNLQNIPQKSEYAQNLRSAFVASKGFVFVAFDFSQIELRIMASLSGDKKMIAIFTSGGDIHTATAAQVANIDQDKVTSEMRYAAKALNFGIMYGMSQKGFASSAGIDIKQAKKFIDRYFQEFADVAKFIERTKQFVRINGFIQTLLGRKRYLPDIASPNWLLRQAAERAAQNMPAQGLQADIIKTAMVLIDRDILQKYKAEDIRLLLQIHDELVFEIKNNMLAKLSNHIVDIMENCYSLKVPLIVTVRSGEHLGNMKSYEKK